MRFFSHTCLRMNIAMKVTAFICLSITLLSCVSVVESSFKAPNISIVSIQLLQPTVLQQNFSVGVRVGNPNSRPLKLAGINYVLELDKIKVMNGSVSDIPKIAAYGEEVVDVTVSIGLLEGLSFLQSLAHRPRDTISYRLSADLDTGLPVIGIVPVFEEGAIELSDLR